jgi:hypothetical protein
MQALRTDTGVLIAGAGPTGLALAAELTRRGIGPLVIDRQPSGANTSRARVVHARTMEVLESLGATRELLAQGVKVPVFRVRDRDRVLITIDFSEIASPYPFMASAPMMCALSRWTSKFSCKTYHRWKGERMQAPPFASCFDLSTQTENSIGPRRCRRSPTQGAHTSTAPTALAQRRQFSMIAVSKVRW